MEKLVVLLLAGVVVNTCHDHGPMDLSEDCNNNLKINYFLTCGMGYADGLSVYVGNFNKNCTLRLYTNEMDNMTVQIIVVEVATNADRDEFCRNNTITIADESTLIDPCMQLQSLTGNILFTNVVDNHKTVVNIQGNSTEMLKVTATSARSLNENEICSSEEIECVVSNRHLCINIDLLCDGNINCGGYGVFDEDTAKCHSEKYKRHIALIIPGLLLFTISLLIIAKLCHRCLPKIPRHFYQTDNLEDNKLIVRTKEPTKLASNERRVLSGDIEEREIRTVDYEKLPKKRLTTNSPVYRNTRVATILLDDIRNMQSGDGLCSDTDIIESQSEVYEMKNYSKGKTKGKQRRHTISDFI